MRYRVLGMLCVLAAIAYVQRAAISVPAKEVGQSLRFDDLATQMGRVQSVWYLLYALCQLPSGWLADRVGSRVAITLYCLGCSIMTAVASTSLDYESLLWFWGLMGAAQAGLFPCAAKMIGQYFGDHERARASGLLAAGMALGGAMAPGLTGALLQMFGVWGEVVDIEPWRICFALYGMPGLLWGLVFIAFIVPDQATEETPASLKPHDGVQASRRFPWWRLVTSGSMWLLCGQQFLRAAAMVFFLTWFPTFLRETRGSSELAAGVLTSVAGLGSLGGCLLGGVSSDWLLRRTRNKRLSRQGIAVAGMAICGGLILGSYFVDNTIVAVTLIGLGAFCATFGGISGYTVAIDFGGRHVATVFSTMNMWGNIGAALFPVTVGWLVKETGNWNLALFLFAGIMLVDAACWAILNPQGTLFGDEAILAAEKEQVEP